MIRLSDLLAVLLLASQAAIQTGADRSRPESQDRGHAILWRSAAFALYG